MKKFKILLLGIVAFILSSCYTTVDTTRPPATYEVYHSYPYETSVYLIYDFTCMHCYYDTYFYLSNWHVRITHFCSHHYNWYYTWYRPHHNNWYSDYKYYYDNYKYRDRSRHFIRNNQGYRNYDDRDGTKVYDNRKPKITRDKQPKIDRNKTYKQPKVDRNKTYKQPRKTYKQPKVDRNKTYKQPKVDRNKQPKIERKKTTTKRNKR